MTPRLVEHGSLLALELPRGEPSSEQARALDLAGRDVPLRRDRRAHQPPDRHAGDVRRDPAGQRDHHGAEAVLAGRGAAADGHPAADEGLAAMPSPGGVRKIVRIEGAAFPFVTDLAAARGDEVVTTLLPLAERSRPTRWWRRCGRCSARTRSAFAYAPTNSLILGGSAALITRIANIVQSLDAKGADRLFLRPSAPRRRRDDGRAARGRLRRRRPDRRVARRAHEQRGGAREGRLGAARCATSSRGSTGRRPAAASCT